MSYQTKKKFGQHFLVNPGVIDHIVACIRQGCEKQNTNQVVEIGPGQGALTSRLLDNGFEVLAIEIDPDCVESLEKRWGSNPRFRVLNHDVLELDTKQLPQNFVAAGNLPYNVGTEIVVRVLETWAGTGDFIWMLQKEVIERLLATSNTADYGNLAVKFAWSTECLEHFWVKPGSFQPPPKVDSGVAHFRRLAEPLANPLERGSDYDRAAPFVRQAFLKRRKMLRGSFPSLPAELGTKRPQELSPGDFLFWGLQLGQQNSG